MHTITRVVIASFALAAAASAQVTFVPALPERPLRYEVGSDYSLRRGPSPEAAGTVLKQSAVLRFDAAAHQPEAGMTLHMTIERLRVELTVFDSIVPEGKVTLLEWGGEGEVTLPAGAPAAFAAYPELVKTGADIRLRADGSVESITGHEAAYQVAKPGDTPRTSYLGSFSQAGVVSMVESLFAVDPDSKPRTVGDEWSRVELIQLTASRRALTTTSLTLIGVGGDTAKVTGLVKTEVQPPKGVPDPADPKLAIAEQRGSVALEWDMKAGRLLSRTAERFIVWEATLDVTAKPMVVKDYTSSRHTAKLVSN